MDFADFADSAGLDVFNSETRIVERMSLVAHLGGEFGFLGALGEAARFIDGPGKWLLHVNVLV